MSTDRIHRAVSADGTMIAGRVHGEGAPLVLVHGPFDDGWLDWGPALPLLSEHFAVHLMSLRGRGPSGPSADLSPERLVEDVAAYADSLGEPVGAAGISGSSMWVLGAASRTSSVAAVAVHEPVVFEVAGAELIAGFSETLATMEHLAERGLMSEAARAFLEGVCTDKELEAMEASGAFDQAGQYVPVDLEQVRQAVASSFSATDPARLARISAPVLVTLGSDTPGSWFADGAQHIAQHVADFRVREITGGAHLSPWSHPEAVAEEFTQFFGVALTASGAPTG